MIWTAMAAVWMPVYLVRFHKQLAEKRKALLIAVWCVSFFTAVCISVSETVMARAVSLTAVVFILAAIAVIDHENKLIPNRLQLHLAAVGVIEHIVLFFADRDVFPYRLAGNLLTGFGLFAILLVIALLSKGLGGGDVKLLGLLGCICGYTITVSVLLWALISSMLVSVALLVMKKKEKKDTMPFGPFVFVGYLVSMAALYKDVWRM